MGSALGVRTRLRTLPQRYRSTDRGSACTALFAPLYPGEAPPVQEDVLATTLASKSRTICCSIASVIENLP